MKNMLKKIRKTSERGQAIIIIAFALVGLVAIVGLMIDGGIMLIEYARIKRGIDAASIAAASQFRKGFVGADLEKAGQEFLKLNGVDVNPSDVKIFTCDYPNTTHDATLCAAPGEPKRKLVRIVAKRYVNFGFMRVVGINGSWIEATSIGEAASIDLVLAIDTSSSMAYETTTEQVPDGSGGWKAPDPNRSDQGVFGGHAGDDPIACNNDPTRRCEPMGTVKDVAVDFVEELFFPYDRVSVVAFTGQQTDGSAVREPVRTLAFEDDQGTVESAIRDLRVFQPFTCPTDGSTPPGPCLYFEPSDGHYVGQPCFPYQFGTKDASGNLITDASGNVILDPTSCGASNIGAGLFLAGDQFPDARQDSFWAVIALIGGPANAAVTDDSPPSVYCPSDTWDLPGGSGFCRDLDPMPASFTPPAVTNWSDTSQVTAFNAYATAFNWATYDMATASRHPKTDVAHYDADDYARDGADYITSRTTGNGASLYSICLGTYCRAYPNANDPASAELLGRYMAYHAGGASANHGLYFQSNSAADLAAVFQSIADNIFTRISK